MTSTSGGGGGRVSATSAPWRASSATVGASSPCKLSGPPDGAPGSGWSCVAAAASPRGSGRSLGAARCSPCLSRGGGVSTAAATSGRDVTPRPHDGHLVSVVGVPQCAQSMMLSDGRPNHVLFRRMGSAGTGRKRCCRTEVEGQVSTDDSVAQCCSARFYSLQPPFVDVLRLWMTIPPIQLRVPPRSEPGRPHAARLATHLHRRV